MSRYTDHEVALAERYVSVLDYVSRCAQAVDGGNWRYLWDKTGQLRAAVDALADTIREAGITDVVPFLAGWAAAYRAGVRS